MEICRQFIHSEVLTNSVTAAFGHARVYRNEASERDKLKCRETLRSTLQQLIREYEHRREDEKHIENLLSLCATMTHRCASVLRNGEFRFGIAQKALNLFLKYHWCLGDIPEPPHCPFDAIVIAKLPKKSRVLWTATNSVEEYQSLVAAARLVAGEQSIARWELKLWQEAVHGGSHDL